MTESLLISFKDSERRAIYRPFCYQVVANDYWVPLARQQGWPLLSDLGYLLITERQEAEQLISELESAQTYLQGNNDPRYAVYRDYMIERAGENIEAIQEALKDWEAVEDLSL